MDKSKKERDVADANDLLLRTLTLVFRLWHGGKVGQSSLEAAERIAAHQGSRNKLIETSLLSRNGSWLVKGCHEAEVSCGGEADLHRRSTRCKKNPGHAQFIPVQDFNIDHLPSGYQDELILDWIKVNADLTCRLLVTHTSKNRPKFDLRRLPLSYYPFYQDRGGDSWRAGTGYVEFVHEYTEKDDRVCECDECNKPGSHKPEKVWGKVVILTACHVVFDSDEARHTTCDFFYDASKPHVSKCLTLTGLKFEKSNILADWCKMTYVSHDTDVIDTLAEIQRRRQDLYRKILNKCPRPSVRGVPVTTYPTPEPTVIISHPHGCSKMVTVGMWTHREALGKTNYKCNATFEVDQEVTRYTYNTPTCRGSSGAPVFRLTEIGKFWCILNYHIHSEGSQGNVNESGFWYEVVSTLSTRVPSKIVVSPVL